MTRWYLILYWAYFPLSFRLLQVLTIKSTDDKSRSASSLIINGFTTCSQLVWLSLKRHKRSKFNSFPVGNRIVRDLRPIANVYHGESIMCTLNFPVKPLLFIVQNENSLNNSIIDINIFYCTTKNYFTVHIWNISIEFIRFRSKNFFKYFCIEKWTLMPLCCHVFCHNT